MYHTVEKKQTLYAISKLYNVTVAEIKQWNNLTADGLKRRGEKLLWDITVLLLHQKQRLCLKQNCLLRRSRTILVVVAEQKGLNRPLQNLL